MYDVKITIKKGLKDAVITAVVVGITVLTQVSEQCPDLAVSVGGIVITSAILKGLIQAANNVRKNIGE